MQATSASKKIPGDWILFGAVTSLLMWHNGYTTYQRVSGHFANVSANASDVSANVSGISLIALAEAIVTVIVVEFTSAYFLHAQKHETTLTRRRIAAAGVVIPLFISGLINLNISDQIADYASRIATMACACIVAAWHWFVAKENPLNALAATIEALEKRIKALASERDLALAQANAIENNNSRTAEMIRKLQNDIAVMRDAHYADINALKAAHANEIAQLTHTHTAALAAAKASATANVTNVVNVNAPNAANVSRVSDRQSALAPNVTALALTEDALALTINERRANSEPVNSDLLAAMFCVSAARIRQMSAWKNREVQHEN